MYTRPSCIHTNPFRMSIQSGAFIRIPVVGSQATYVALQTERDGVFTTFTQSMYVAVEREETGYQRGPDLFQITTNNGVTCLMMNTGNRNTRHIVLRVMTEDALLVAATQSSKGFTVGPTGEILTSSAVMVGRAEPDVLLHKEGNMQTLTIHANLSSWKQWQQSLVGILLVVAFVSLFVIGVALVWGARSMQANPSRWSWKREKLRAGLFIFTLSALLSGLYTFTGASADAARLASMSTFDKKATDVIQVMQSPLNNNVPTRVEIDAEEASSTVSSQWVALAQAPETATNFAELQQSGNGVLGGISTASMAFQNTLMNFITSRTANQTLVM